MALAYPNRPSDRDRWIIKRRTTRHPLDPQRPHAFLVEQERAESGEVVPVATIFLTNRECPWHCLMCDLWKNTLTESVPAGAIPAQIDYALNELAKAHGPGLHPGSRSSFEQTRQIKLYNSGSFFDPRAIPPQDHRAIGDRVRDFKRVIVECHPALVTESVVKFRDLLRGARLEVAMGLETVHPEVLPRLNKRMTLDQFNRAAAFLQKYQIALRVFILVKPPFLNEDEALLWAQRSLDFAFDCGATVASLIPTRLGNGALDALAEHGEFSQPRLSTLELSLAYGVTLKRGRAFADLWDLNKFSECATCFEQRMTRLRDMNLRQLVTPEINCPACRTLRGTGVSPASQPAAAETPALPRDGG